MAADNEASYSKIGMFILSGIILITCTLVYLGGVGGNKKVLYLETYFKNEVSGLDVGSAVNFRGVRFGQVKRISFIGAEYSDALQKHKPYVYVLMELDLHLCQYNEARTGKPYDFVKGLIRRGLHATVSASGVTGLSHIELNFPKSKIEDEEISWRSEYPIIPPAPSILESAADSATKILNEINQMNLAVVWSNIVVISDSVKNLCGNLDVLLDGNREQMNRILGNFGSASESIRDLAAELKDNPSLLIRSRDAEILPETR